MCNVALDMADDDLPRLLEQAYAHAGFAAGEGDFEQRAYKKFCADMSRLEEMLRDKGLLPPATKTEDE